MGHQYDNKKHLNVVKILRNEKLEEIECKYLIGTDGVNSVVRKDIDG